MCFSASAQDMCSDLQMYTVEPPNKGQTSFVLCKEVVLFGWIKMFSNYKEEMFCDLKLCPLQRGCPYFGGSTIRDFTVLCVRRFDPGSSIVFQWEYCAFQSVKYLPHDRRQVEVADC